MAKSKLFQPRRGELKNFTGIDSPYETPEDPEIRIDTVSMTPEQAADEIVRQLLKRDTDTQV